MRGLHGQRADVGVTGCEAVWRVEANPCMEKEGSPASRKPGHAKGADLDVGCCLY